VTDKRTREYYRRCAPEYEQIYYRDVPERRDEIDVEAAWLREHVENREVLDLACGTGYWTRIMAETAALVVASDLSGEMITEARTKKYHAAPLFVQADLEQLPIAEHCFDVVALGFWFSHQPRQQYEAFFDRMRRLIRPDGTLWLIDNNPPAEGPTLDSTGIDKSGNHYKRRYLDNGDAYIILKNYFEREDLAGIFEPYFRIDRLAHNRYYWSIVLSNK